MVKFSMYLNRHIFVMRELILARGHEENGNNLRIFSKIGYVECIH